MQFLLKRSERSVGLCHPFGVFVALKVGYHRVSPSGFEYSETPPRAQNFAIIFKTRMLP